MDATQGMNRQMAEATARAMGKCECCDAPAVVIVADWSRGRPVEDNVGFWHPTVRRAGVHRFCATHQREPETTDSPEFRQWCAEHPEALEKE